MADIGRAKVPVEFDKTAIARDADAAITPAIGDAAKNAAKLVAGSFVATKAFNFAKEAVQGIGDAEKAAAQTAAAIKATGGAANVTADQVGELTSKLRDQSAVDDDVITAGANMLLTFKNIKNEVGAGNDVFDQATQAALDLSAAGFGSMESASVMLGKALNDPVQGISALTRVGVTFTDQQKATVQALVATGDMLGAQKVILQEVEGQVGGAAAAYRDTLPGALSSAQLAVDDAKESMLEGLVPAIQFGASAVTTLAEGVQELPGPLRTVATVAIGAGIGIAGIIEPASNLLQSINALKTARLLSTASDVGKLADSTGAATTAAKSLKGPLLGVAAGVALAAAAWEGYNRRTTVSVDVTKAAASSTRDLVDGFKKFSGLGVTTQFLDQFVHGGEAGVGTLQRLRDEVARTGGDTTQLDAALQQAKTEFDNTKTSTEKAAVALGTFKTAEEQAKEQADLLNESLKRRQEHLDGIEQQANEALTAQSNLVSQTFSEHDADIARREALEKIAEAQEKVNKATTPEEQADAQLELEKATLNYGKAIDSQAKSQADLEIATREGAGETLTASEKTKIYLNALEHLTSDAVGPAKTALEELRAKIGDVSQQFQATLDYDLSINGYHLTATEVQAVIDAGLGIPLQSLNKEAQKQSGEFQTRGAFALGGFAPAGVPFEANEWGPEIALLHPGQNRLDRDAFVLTAAQTAAAMSGGKGGLTVGSINVGTRADLPKVRTELKRLSLASGF